MKIVRKKFRDAGLPQFTKEAAINMT